MIDLPKENIKCISLDESILIVGLDQSKTYSCEGNDLTYTEAGDMHFRALVKTNMNINVGPPRGCLKTPRIGLVLGVLLGLYATVRRLGIKNVDPTLRSIFVLTSRPHCYRRQPQ